MKRTSRLVAIQFISLLVFAALTVTLRTVACIRDLTYKTGYYGDDLLITVANCICAFAAVILVIYAALPSNKNGYNRSLASPLAYIPAGAVSVALVFFSATSLYELVKLPGAFFSAKTFSDTDNVMLAILSVLALVSIAYFMLESIFEKNASPERAAFGMVLVAMLALYAAYIYFNDDMPINSQIKITDQIAFALCAVFFLFECRISLARSKWNGYIAFGSVAALLSAYSSIPTLITYFAKKTLISTSLPAAVLLFAISILIIMRIALLLLSAEDKRCDTAEAIALMSQARADEIKEARLARAHVNNQNEENEAEELANEADEANYTIDLGESLDSTPGEG